MAIRVQRNNERWNVLHNYKLIGLITENHFFTSGIEFSVEDLRRIIDGIKEHSKKHKRNKPKPIVKKSTRLKKRPRNDGPQDEIDEMIDLMGGYPRS